MKLRGLVFISLLALLPTVCKADSLCPWMNAATAFGMLGGTENPAMRGAPEVSATACTFTYRAESGIRELRITVEPQKDPAQAFQSYKAQCGSDRSDLRAIGNEAVVCIADRKGHAQGEQVIGRVRENIFVVTVSTSGKKDSFLSREVLAEKARSAAELVAGNLF